MIVQRSSPPFTIKSLTMFCAIIGLLRLGCYNHLSLLSLDLWILHQPEVDIFSIRMDDLIQSCIKVLAGMKLPCLRSILWFFKGVESWPSFAFDKFHMVHRVLSDVIGNKIFDKKAMRQTFLGKPGKVKSWTKFACDGRSNWRSGNRDNSVCKEQNK
jgi:hypothetical protein